MQPLRRKVIHLAKANPKLRPFLLGLLKSADGEKEWAEVIYGNGCRIKWRHQGYGQDRDTLIIEEVPGKPHRARLKRATINASYYWSILGQHNDFRSWGVDAFILDNLLRTAKLHSGMSYGQALAAMAGAIEAAAREVTENSKGAFEFSKYGGLHSIISENEVNYLTVEPNDYNPVTAQGKDFQLKAEWTSFKVYSPNSDFQQTQPHYTLYEAKSPLAARKLYLLLKAAPNALSGVSWATLGDWLKSKGIAYGTHFSQWT